MKVKTYKSKQLQRKARTRAKVASKATRPRLTVFRSNKHLSAQIIDQNTGNAITGAHTGIFKSKTDTKSNLATKLGEHIAKIASTKKIKSLTLDRGPYKYHGRVKALAEAIRNAGIKI
jgi:large subunit ribosomal protein L18